MRRVDQIRERAAAATPGPWRWAGNVDAHHIELTTVDRGMLYVMRFVRWGMRSAQPMFQPLPIGSHTAMVKATEVPIFEVAPDATSREDRRVYRGDLIGLRHPDADFIAHSRRDVDYLVAQVDALEDALWTLYAELTGEKREPRDDIASTLIREPQYHNALNKAAGVLEAIGRLEQERARLPELALSAVGGSHD